MKYMCLLSNIVYLVKDTLSFEKLLSVYLNFVKERLHQHSERSINTLFSIYFNKKLIITMNNQLPQSFKFGIIELSSVLKRSCEDLNELSCALIQECLDLSTLRDSNDKLILFLDENLNFILNFLNKSTKNYI
jgi:hypothetical protein